MMPATGLSSFSNPSRMPQAGTPEMKARVPSMGSMIQDQALAPGVNPSSSPWMGLSGQARDRPARISASTPRSATVTGSNAPSPSLFSISIGLRKCRSARRPASSTSGRATAIRSATSARRSIAIPQELSREHGPGFAA